MSVESAKAFCVRMMSDEDFRNAVGAAGDAAGITAVIGGEYAGHSASVEKSAIQESIEEVSVKVDYFRLPDGKDNDGDGRVDEEKLNGSDDDGDGLIDEDLGV